MRSLSSSMQRASAALLAAQGCLSSDDCIEGERCCCSSCIVISLPLFYVMFVQQGFIACDCDVLVDRGALPEFSFLSGEGRREDFNG